MTSTITKSNWRLQTEMTKIGIFGLGNWGTALAKIWIEEGHTVCGWTIEQDVYESITMNSRNNKYLKEHSVEGLHVTMHLDECLELCEIVVLALPSSVILDVVNEMIPSLKQRHVLLDLAKGLAPGDSLISDSIKNMLRDSDLYNSVAVLTGPTIAPEVAEGVITNALLASEDKSIAKRLAERLSTSSLNLHAASDPHGAELWGAFKNVVALACGIVDGLKKVGNLGGDNLKAAIFTAGFAEGCRLLPNMGASPETAFGPAGMGDLFVTATSPHGRNRRMGEKLGKGLLLHDALDEMVMVAEGVRAARMFLKRATEMKITVDFVNTLVQLLDGEIDAEECVRRMVCL